MKISAFLLSCAVMLGLAFASPTLASVAPAYDDPVPIVQVIASDELAFAPAVAVACRDDLFIDCAAPADRMPTSAFVASVVSMSSAIFAPAVIGAARTLIPK